MADLGWTKPAAYFLMICIRPIKELSTWGAKLAWQYLVSL
jgi:hypothetical protein